VAILAALVGIFYLVVKRPTWPFWLLVFLFITGIPFGGKRWGNQYGSGYTKASPPFRPGLALNVIIIIETVIIVAILGTVALGLLVGFPFYFLWGIVNNFTDSQVVIWVITGGVILTSVVAALAGFFVTDYFAKPRQSPAIHYVITFLFILVAAVTPVIRDAAAGNLAFDGGTGTRYFQPYYNTLNTNYTPSNVYNTVRIRHGNRYEEKPCAYSVNCGPDIIGQLKEPCVAHVSRIYNRNWTGRFGETFRLIDGLGWVSGNNGVQFNVIPPLGAENWPTCRL